MCDRLDELVTRVAVLQCEFQVKGQLTHPVEGDQSRYGNEAAIALRQAGPLPDVAKKDLHGVGQARRRRMDCAARWAYRSSGGLLEGPARYSSSVTLAIQLTALPSSASVTAT
jgi:hypothetical protein